MLNRLFLLLLMLSVSSVYANGMEAPTAQSKKELAAQYAHHLGVLRLFHDGKGYVVIDKKGEHRVANYDLDGMLKQMPATHLESFEKNGGYIEVRKFSNGEYRLISHVRPPNSCKNI